MKAKKVLPYLVTAAASLCAGLAMTALLLRPRALDTGTLSLSGIADGEYVGVCQNRILLAVVRVRVQDHAIAEVEILEHKASYMEQAEAIAEAVCSAQSLEVDAVSGATLTSGTVLKAIENALKDAEISSGRK